MLGWDNVFHCEINPFGRAVLEYWFPESKSYEDITKTDFTEWRGKIDVLTGGFPCQPFSYAGKRGGREDERYLWPQMLRVIDEIRPTWVVGENVAGFTTMVEGGVCTDLGKDGQARFLFAVDAGSENNISAELVASALRRIAEESGAEPLPERCVSSHRMELYGMKEEHMVSLASL